MAKCPECGLDKIEEGIEWEVELDDYGVHVVGTCPECGSQRLDQEKQKPNTDALGTLEGNIDEDGNINP